MRIRSVVPGMCLRVACAIAALSALPAMLAAPALGSVVDCNSNGVDDAADIQAGTSDDCDGNGIPDECDVRATFVYAQEDDVAIPDFDVFNPDNHASQDLVIADAHSIEKLEIQIEIDHEWVGDLSYLLVHVDTGTTVTLLDQIGVPELNGGYGTASNRLDVRLADSFPTSIDDSDAGEGNPIVGNFHPAPGALATFNGQSIGGTWRVQIFDRVADFVGTSRRWALIVHTRDPSADCNDDAIPDACQLAENDCDSNQVPDDCQVDTDEDGTIDPCDGCPNDPNKTTPEFCGCGNAETDGDGDGTPDCVDGCPGDPNKTDPGVCGCGIPETDSDGDGTPDCADLCPQDPLKTEPGVCGCGVPDTDTDGDGTPNCIDGCPGDPNKTEPGDCGCGVPDTDSDGDGVPDCLDVCPGGDDNLDCDDDGVPDACDDEEDCDDNGVPDTCEIEDGSADDCNGNGVPDPCDIDEGTSVDCIRNGIPDECEPPYTASAGPDVTMRLGDPPVTLGGTPVASGGIPPYSYSWTIIAGPLDQGLANVTAERATFSPPAGGQYTIRVDVSDSSVPPCTRSDMVVVTVLALQLDAGLDQEACVGEPTAPLGGFPVVTGGTPPYSYFWVVAVGPTSSGFSDRTAEHPTFTPAFADDYTLRVNVTDRSNPPLTGMASVVVRGIIVTANAGPNRTLDVNQPMQLGATPTASGGVPPYAYAWTLVTNPGGNGTLTDKDTSAALFIASGAGAYVVQLEVTDSLGCTASDVVILTVTSAIDDGGTPGPSPLPGDLCGVLCAPSGPMVAALLLVSYAGLLTVRRGRRRKRAGR